MYTTIWTDISDQGWSSTPGPGQGPLLSRTTTIDQLEACLSATGGPTLRQHQRFPSTILDSTLGIGFYGLEFRRV
jgi:hypothetical protein